MHSRPSVALMAHVMTRGKSPNTHTAAGEHERAQSELRGDRISSLGCKGLFNTAEDSYELSQMPAIDEKRRCGIEWHRSAHWARMARRCSMASAGCSLVTTRIGRARAHRHHGAPSAASCDRSETYVCRLLDGLAYAITRPVISRNLLDESNEVIN